MGKIEFRTKQVPKLLKLGDTEPDEVLIPTFTVPDATDVLLAKDIGDALYKHYPNWGWTVEIPAGHQQGIVIIRNISLDPRGVMGYVIHRSKIEGANAAKVAVRVGGEILEAHNARRGPWRDGDDVLQQVRHG